MYINKINKQDDPTAIRAFLRANGFAIVVNVTDGRLWATHIPLLLDTNEEGEEVLSGHLSIANPQWKYFEDGKEVLAIFSGPHAYISSSWYDHENVPTWNYIAVHVYGTTRILKGDAVTSALKKMVDKYEAHSAHPVSVEGMSPNYFASQVRGIVCFEIAITDIQAAYKLSQNRDDKNFDNIVHELHARNDADSVAVAREMVNIRYSTAPK